MYFHNNARAIIVSFIFPLMLKFDGPETYPQLVRSSLGHTVSKLTAATLKRIRTI